MELANHSKFLGDMNDGTKDIDIADVNRSSSQLYGIIKDLGDILNEFKLGLALINMTGEINAANDYFRSLIDDPDFYRSLLALMHESLMNAEDDPITLRRMIGTSLVSIRGPLFKQVYLIFIAEWSAREGWAAQFTSASDISVELQAVLDSCFDEVHITDGEGITLKVSSSCQRIFGVPVEEFLHKSVFELERMGIFVPSSTRMVIEQNRPIMISQKTAAGKTLLVTARPIFDESGELVKVINTSKDITEMRELEAELETTRNLAERYRAALAETRSQHVKVNFICSSAPMEAVLKTARRVARLDSTVLLMGETGVGKDTIASYIHDVSPRAGEPFIAVNCGAIPESLFESELFGYEPGAFTGAQKEGKAGLIEMAHKGTLFLDEVTGLSLALQVKLLRVLQDKRVTRVGGTRCREFDVRVIAASNRNIEKEVQGGNFREDLYYRLAVVPVRIPPLRERSEDMPPLIHYYITKFNNKYGENRRFSTDAIKALESYNWPGNVRELQNFIERVVVTSEGDVITVNDLPEHLHAATLQNEGIAVTGIINWYEARDALEEQLLNNAAGKYHSTYEIAKALGVSQSMVFKKLTKLKQDNSMLK
ncbi:MAG: sigma 54-interacting transcriptional regulator [Thermacetogeniaceae bacterium]|jgi:transcriptional regulator with PAS, ATPase and Fis domain